ncbi:helix-turn-helix protein [mine drainage metagenome]|uniref:Helix-turn-helix protein n=1 Tax=mine drainage metagenome TaxID=410659 RepID=A0A1J5QLL5_9ZZZZ
MRLQQGWTQVVFSERCGFYQTYLSRIENGQANPTLSAMEVIASGLGLTIFELFERVRLGLEPAAVAAEPASPAGQTNVADGSTEPSPGCTPASNLAATVCE